MHSQKLIMWTCVARHCHWTSVQDLHLQGSGFRLLHWEVVQYLGGGSGYHEYVRSARNGRQCFQTWWVVRFWYPVIARIARHPKGYKEGGEHMIGIIDFVLPLRLLYSFWWKISKSHAHDRVLQETIGRFKSASVIAFSRTPRIFVDQKCVASSLGHAGTTSKLVAGADLSGPTARKTPYREDQRKIIFNPDKPRLLDNLATGNHGEFSSRVVLVSSRLNSDTRLAQARYSAVVRSDKNPNLLRAKGGRPFLDYTLRPNIVTPTRLPQLIEFIDFDMVRLLLDKGANPNKKVSIYGNITVWALFLLSCYEKKDIKNSPAKDTSFKAAELMVRKGAHRKLKLETTRRETIGNRSDAVTLAKTAKYKKVVTRGGMIEVDVPVELAAVSILAEIFGDGKIACLKDQIGVVGTWYPGLEFPPKLGRKVAAFFIIPAGQSMARTLFDKLPSDLTYRFRSSTGWLIPGALR